MKYNELSKIVGWKINTIRKLVSLKVIKGEYGSINKNEVDFICSDLFLQHWINFCTLTGNSSNFIRMTSEFHKAQFSKIFSKELSLIEQFYWYSNDLNSYPTLCVECNKPCKQFHSFKLGYINKFCSKTCALSCDLTLAKKIKTSQNNFGVDNPSQDESIKMGKRKKMLEKYGATGPMDGELKQKTQSTFFKKYGTSMPMKNSEISSKMGLTSKQNSFDKIMLNDKFKLMFSKSDYEVYGSGNYMVQHDCGHVFQLKFPSALYLCPICDKSKYRSKLEETVINLLPTLDNIDIGKKIKLNDKILYPDIKIGNLIIELDGNYWHSELRNPQNKIKSYNRKKLFLTQNLKSMFFFEDEILNKPEIVASMIKAKLGLFSQKIAARKCIISEISNDLSKTFLLNNHIQGSAGGSFKFGIFYKNELVGVLISGNSRFRSGSIEIIRLAFKLNTAVMGGSEKLLKYLIKSTKKQIISYSDNRFGEGAVYERMGFNNISNNRPAYFYIKKSNYLSRISRLKFQKHKLKNMISFSEELSEWQIMQLEGYDRIWDCGSKTWALIKCPPLSLT